MTSITNRRIVLASRPHGEPSADNFRIEDVALPPTGHDQIWYATASCRWTRTCADAWTKARPTPHRSRSTR